MLVPHPLTLDWETLVQLAAPEEAGQQNSRWNTMLLVAVRACRVQRM
jgi:hypothetical protein